MITLNKCPGLNMEVLLEKEGWVTSWFYCYHPLQGIMKIYEECKDWNLLKNNDKQRYRLLDIKTGKIIPGELL